MKLFNQFLVLIFVLSTPGFIYAADFTGLTRSAGKLVDNSNVDLTEKLLSSSLLESDISKPRGIESALSSSPTQQYRTANHVSVAEFEIFDAWVELSGDIDDDGFFHRIKATFDADVNTPLETVYAKLYVSYEGGPWQQYASSDLFEIAYDSIDDTYEVVSELIDGYAPGYYDVLIELHSLYHAGIVASQIITLDIEGYSLTLEDLQHDEIVIVEQPYYETDYYEADHYIAAGSFSWAGLILLGFLFIIKFRFFSSKQNQ